VALLLLLLAGWLTLPSPKLWTLVVVVVVFAPAFLGLVQQLFRKPPDSLLRLHIAVALRSTVVRCAQAVVALACLPHEAFVNADAVLRTTWRMLVSHRRRLAWSPFGAQTQGSALSVLASFRAMWAAPAACDGDHRRTGRCRGRRLCCGRRRYSRCGCWRPASPGG
jgi:hypothetical protein